MLIGHKNHPEVIGTIGQLPIGSIDLIESIDDVEKYKNSNKDIAYVTQTTLSVDDTKDIIDKLKNKFPDIKEPKKDDICYATTNRQEVTVKLAKKVDLILVVGASNSSNCNRLRDVSIQSGTKAYLINSYDEINPDWLKGIEKIGLTSGASTPDKLVYEIIKKLNPSNVYKFDDIDEDIKFEIPRKVKELLNE